MEQIRKFGDLVHLALFDPYSSLRENSWYLEFFWSVFSRIRSEYREIWSISLYSAQMRENTDQKTPNRDTFYAVREHSVHMTI